MAKEHSHIFQLLAAQVAAIFLMLSCASSQPLPRLTVHAEPGFIGTIRISTCIASAAAAEISVDAAGMGETSTCPSRVTSVTVVVVRGDQQSTVAPEDVSILRTGDGIATSIRAEVRR